MKRYKYIWPEYTYAEKVRKGERFKLFTGDVIESELPLDKSMLFKQTDEQEYISEDTEITSDGIEEVLEEEENRKEEVNTKKTKTKKTD